MKYSAAARGLVVQDSHFYYTCRAGTGGALSCQTSQFTAAKPGPLNPLDRVL